MIRSNWISSLGAGLATFALIASITGWVLHSTGHWTGPYLGLMTVLVLPGLFLLSLLLIPLGLLLYRRHLRERLERLTDKPLYLARAVVVITLVNLLAVGTAGYGGASYMSSVQFCGTACHEAMQPEYDAYRSSAHAHVDCVACHVGDGTTWFVKSKLNGAKQLWGYLNDNYHKPIPTPIHDMRSARETCENCHWPEKYLGTKLLVRPRFRENEAVTSYINVLLMRTGGTRPDGRTTGIHWHVNPDVQVEYVAADRRREQIDWIRTVDAAGNEKIYTAEGVDPSNPPAGERRFMDCNDCHNRDAHAFDLPEDAVDRAIAAGLINRRLPWIKKYAVEALHGDYTRDGAEDGIRRTLLARYNPAGLLDEDTRPLLEPAIREITRIWQRNVYPDRKLTWNSYPDLSTHFGCMRCHDGEHRAADGSHIRSACDDCHVVLSNEEEDPAILESLGLGTPR